MSKISRSDLYGRSEKGGQWFEDFLKQFSESAGNEIFNKQTVSSVVDNYRHLTGLDKIASEKDESIVVVIEGDENLKSSLESILENSGGKRGTHAIINFLREELGNDIVSYSDDSLIDYINDMKSKYDANPSYVSVDVGKIGTDNFDDQKADFIEHGKGM